MPADPNTDVITWVLQASLPEGQRPALEAVMHEMIDATRTNEPGCLLYDWYISADGGTCHILESYADDAALMTHIASFNARFARRLFGIIKPVGLTIYGNPSAEARAALAPLRPVYLSRL
ncbi:MAG: antibiotic biosynthesis monooxygenase [Rhodobacteraceae bacterium]|jgi:quinol monooxygenase YgiN|nr:antibiotic biosynthesis monooxygenase [Paracoccaceae bacterium]